MRAAAILGLGCRTDDLKPFQTDDSVVWRMGVPASKQDADVVLLLGGDGTIHRHLSPLMKLALPVLVVPAGSGNDFARAMGIRRVRDSLAAWRKFSAGSENVRPIDLGVITPVGNAGGRQGIISDESGHPRYFCCVAGVGLDGEVAARANRLPRWLRGHGGYALSLVPSILGFSPVPMKIASADDESWSVRSDRLTLLAAFANTPLYGGGMRIAPRARMDDGLLDVCVVGAVGALRLLRLFPRVYSGRHLAVPEIEYFQAGRVRVETEHPVDVYADGEFVGRTPVEVGVERAALKVVVPAKNSLSG